MSEQWKPIADLGNRYAVSSLGRIKHVRLGKLVNTSVSNAGYLLFTTKVGDKVKSRSVHRDVAKAFVEGYEPGLVVNHLDGSKTNNVSTNLEWTTYTGNNRHAVIAGLQRTKLTPVQVVNIRHCRGEIGPTKLAALYGVHISTIRRIQKQSLWRCESTIKRRLRT